MSEGVIDFVQPYEKGKIHSEVFTMSDQMVKVLIDQIKYVADEIMNLTFWDSVCDNKECEYCRLRQIAF